MDFKVSDWVRIKTPIFEYDGTDRIAEGIKKLSIKDMWIFDENHFKMNPDRYIVHWKPQEGEWCFDEFNGLIKIRKIMDTQWASAVAYNPFSEKECIVILDQCEPFIGTLPSFLKE